MRERKLIEENVQKVMDIGMSGSGSVNTGIGVTMGHTAISLEILLDLRDQNSRIIELLSAKSKPRRMIVEEANMTDRERELLNSLEEK